MITIEVKRRFSDLDPLGHVNNVAFHDYLQEARMGLIGDLDAVVNDDYAQIVVEQHIKHLRTLGFDQRPLRIEMGIDDMARTSYTIRYRMRDENDDVVAEASTRMAVVSPETGRPIRISDELKDRLMRAGSMQPSAG